MFVIEKHCLLQNQGRNKLKVVCLLRRTPLRHTVLPPADANLRDCKRVG